MSDKPLISIIIPAYNSEKTLKRAVNSIGKCNQVEIIIVENGSSDNTKELSKLLASKDKRIKVYSSDKGVSNARNLGIKMAMGKWITFLDSDDSFTKDAIKTMIYYSKYDSDLISFGHFNGKRIVSHCDSDIFFDDKQIENGKAKMISNPTTYMLAWSKLFKLEIIKNNHVRFSPELSLAEDGDFVIQYLKFINSIVLSHCCLYNYILNNDSTMRSYDDKMSMKYLKALKRGRRLICDESQLVKKSFDRYIVLHINIMMTRGTFSLQNPQKFIKKIRELKRICSIDLLSRAIRGIELKEIKNLRMIPVLLLKYRLYFLAGLIFQLRAKTNEVREKSIYKG